MKFLHLADCHLDAPFIELSQHGDKSNVRRKELKQTFKYALEMGKSYGVDIILISGDVFEHKYVRKSTIDFISNEFNKIPDIKIFISPGNHDPLIHNSYYNTYDWGRNVYFFKDKLDMIYISELNANIYGVGFSDFTVDKPLIDNVKLEHDKINILLTHGSLDVEGNNESYHPIEKSYLESLGFDYCALGHIHKPRINEDTGICYPGSPEPLGFDELGEHGIILGEVTKEYRTINFHPIAKRKYYIKEVDVSGLTNLQDIIDEIKYSFSFDSHKDDFLKIKLIGTIESDIIDTEIIEEELSQKLYFVKIEDVTYNPHFYDKVEDENNIKGLFLKRMNELLDKAPQEDKKMLNKALIYGLDALIKGNVKL